MKMYKLNKEIATAELINPQNVVSVYKGDDQNIVMQFQNGKIAFWEFVTVEDRDCKYNELLNILKRGGKLDA